MQYFNVTSTFQMNFVTKVNLFCPDLMQPLKIYFMERRWFIFLSNCVICFCFEKTIIDENHLYIDHMSMR